MEWAGGNCSRGQLCTSDTGWTRCRVVAAEPDLSVPCMSTQDERKVSVISSQAHLHRGHIQLGTNRHLRLTHGEMRCVWKQGCATVPGHHTSAAYLSAVPKDGENCRGRAQHQAHVRELLARAG
ncbi:unnamed protein product, partial [Bubo scandiacus]